jgi:hypothetical protein
MANTISGRQLIINTAGLINLPCNFKVVEAWWQDIAAAGDTFVFTDAAGRTFTFTAYSAGGTGIPPLPIGKLDWLEGPITVTHIGSGNVYMILGNK